MTTKDERMLEIIFGAELTEEEIKNLMTRQQELLDNWLLTQEKYFDSKEMAIHYYLSCKGEE